MANFKTLSQWVKVLPGNPTVAGLKPSGCSAALRNSNEASLVCEM